MQDTSKFTSGQPFICQLLSYVPQSVFQKAVEQTKTNHYYKKMKAKEHFVFLLYGVLTRKGGLREICKNIPLFGHKLMYWGVNLLPSKSTLADANTNRSSDFFAKLYAGLYTHYKPKLAASFALPIGGEVNPNKVEVFDSTTFTLFKDILKGAGRNAINGKKKGGIKAFCKVNLVEGVPDFVCFKAASTNENTFLKVLNLQEGSIAVFDKGFNRYRCFDEWTQKNRFFVTRSKDNASYTVIKENDILQDPDVKKDQIIELSYSHEKVKRTVQLRLITYLDPENQQTITFLTNLMDYKAITIKLLYKNRWMIEVLFKQMKQNFEVKYFFSDSENGIKSQIWVALILNLLFTVIHKAIKEAEDFKTMVSVVAKNLAIYVDIVLFFTQTEQYIKLWHAAEFKKVQPKMEFG
jgi:Transposase DDE domain/Domain of unknown function (DUF4372)